MTIIVIAIIIALIAWGIIADVRTAWRLDKIIDRQRHAEARQIEIIELLAPPRPIKPVTKRRNRK